MADAIFCERIVFDGFYWIKNPWATDDIMHISSAKSVRGFMGYAYVSGGMLYKDDTMYRHLPTGNLSVNKNPEAPREEYEIAIPVEAWFSTSWKKNT